MGNIIFFITQAVLLVAVAILAGVLVYRAFNRQYLKKIKDNIEIISFEYQRELLIRREKQKKLKIKKNRSIFYRMSLLIERTGLKNGRIFWFVNPQIVILVCICSSFFFFLLFERVFKVTSVGAIMAFPGFFVPIIGMSFIAQKKETDIEKVLVNYLLQLKNNTRIHNDIIEAFRAVQDNCIEPLKTFTKQFLAEINSGVSVEEALDNFKDKVNINRFRLFLTNVRHCYIYGGDFTELLDKTQKLISEIQTEKKRRIQETRSARLVLFVLIGLDLYLYFNFIKAEPEYMSIMRTSFFGQLILNFNFISIWFLVWLSYAVKNLDY